MTTVNSSTSSSYLSSSYVSGLTDIDTASLVQDAYDSKMEAADVVDAEIDDIETQISAYEDLQDLLDALQDATDDLTAQAELDSTRDDVWIGKSAYLTSSDSSVEATDMMGVMVDDTTATGDYNIEIDQLATAHKIGGTTSDSDDTALGLSGSMSISLGDSGTAASIDVTADMTLSDVADAINDSTDTSGVSASVLQISDDQYVLVLSASETGEEINFDADGADTSIAQSLGLIDDTGAYSNELVEAQQAIFSVDGVEVTRSSNTVDDVINGVTLYLYDAEPGTTLNLEIDDDASSAYDAIEAFVDAYNDLRDFMLTNQAYTVGEGADDDAVLFGDSLLSSVGRDVYSALNFSSDSDVYQSLASVGITYDDSNYLVIDEDTLENALTTDFDSVASLFSMSTDTSSDQLFVYDTDGSYSGDFSINISVDADGNLASADIGGDTSLFTIDGNKIVGAEGTAYEGLTLFYSGDTAQTVDVSVSNGLASNLSTSLDRYTDSTDGLIGKKIDDLEEQTDDLNDEVDEITENAQEYADKLVEKYSALETKMYQLQLLREQLQALWGNDDSSS